MSNIFGACPEAWLFISALTTEVYITSFLLRGFRELKSFIVQICDAAPVYRL